MSSWEKFSSEIVEGKKKPALDPVGKEDADINNDGKEDETDSYLRNRRKIRSRIIRKEDYENIEEKAVSKAQQRFFGMVRAAQKGEMDSPSPEVSKAASSMSKSDVKKFASTKHKGLPMKKKTYEQFTTEAAAWTRKAGKSSEGGLNEKGRKSYEKENPGSDLKAPSKKVGNPRRASFCARMKGMKKKLTSKKTASDPDSRINKSLRAWNC